MKKILLPFVLIISAISMQAQDVGPEMATQFITQIPGLKDTLTVSYTYDTQNGGWAEQSRTETRYLAPGKPLEIIHYTWNGTAWEESDRELYSYNTSNQLTQKTTYTWSGSSWTQELSITMTLDANGRVTEKTITKQTGGSQSEYMKSQYSYTAAATAYQMTETISYWDTATSVYVDSAKHEITFDSLDMPLEKIIYLNQGGTMTPDIKLVMEYKYTFYKPILLRKTVYKYNGSSWDELSMEKLSYIDMGKLYKHEFYTFNTDWELTESHEMTFTADGLPKEITVSSNSTGTMAPIGRTKLSMEKNGRIVLATIEAQAYTSGIWISSAKTIVALKADKLGFGCGTSISGQIKLSDSTYLPRGAAKVMLFRLGRINHYITTVDVVDSGYFSISNIPAGDYIVRAIIKDPGQINNVIGAFYPGVRDWEKADTITTTCSEASRSGSMTLLKLARVMNGKGLIAGNLGMLGNTKSGFGIHTSQLKATGEPVPGAEIILEQEPDDDPVGFSISDENGDFSIENVEEGSYSVEIEIPGVEQQSTYVIDVDADGNATVDGMTMQEFNFMVDTTAAVMNGEDTSAASPMSVQGYENDLYAISLYPNPAISQLNISYRLKTGAQVRIDIINTQGSIVSSLKSSQYMTAGEYTESFSMESAGLSPGLYYIRFSSNGNFFAKKLIVR